METNGLGDFIIIYRNYSVTENKSPRTIETVVDSVNAFDTFLGGCTDITKVAAGDLRRYIRKLQTRPRWQNHPTIKGEHGKLSPDSVASYVRSIKSFWSWLSREAFIEDNTIKGVKTPQVSHRIVNTFTPEQVKQLLSAVPRNNHGGYRDYAVILLLYSTGPRISEALELKYQNVDFNSGNIKILGKGARERMLAMPPTLYKAMHKFAQKWRPQQASDYFFVTDDGRQLSRFTFEHKIHAYGEAAGITGVHCRPHVLRYTFAIEFLRNGGDIFSLQKILGHSTLEMTRRYARLADRDVEGKLKTFSPVEKLRLRV